MAHDVPDHVHRNREHWNRRAADYVDRGRANWARPEPDWGIWDVPESAPRRMLAAAGWWRLVAIAVVATVGCATYDPAALEVGRMKPKLQLSGANFKLVRRVTGEASVPLLFWVDIPEGIQRWAFPSLVNPLPVLTIALGDPRLREQAMAALHRQHDMRGKPQLLHNVVEEWTVANYLGLYAVLRVSISADVIEFTGGTAL